MSHTASVGELQEVLQVFRRFDKSNTGRIDRKHLWQVLSKLGLPVGALQELFAIGSDDIDYNEFIQMIMQTAERPLRSLSLPKSVAAVGSVAQWNEDSPDLRLLSRMLSSMCQATTIEQAREEVTAIASLGHRLWAYAYMRRLYERNFNLYHATLMAHPALLLPTVYTPTVGEACQKFGTLPLGRRGCYLSIQDKGNVRHVLEEYAAAELPQAEGGQYLCDCIVFSDGGRILGLGDLGAWGMGIPIGKLDLYTVCAGVNPHRTIPLIIDAGCSGVEGNTDRLVIRDHPLYTGARSDRVTHKSHANTLVNSAYYGQDSIIMEFMQAATDLFGKRCLLQFEDFNSNDAFPLLAEYRTKFLTYNDDIQGTASVCVAALFGALRLRDPTVTDMLEQLRKETFLFHGAGSANLGVISLLRDEARVPASQIFVTNSRGLIWRSEDGSKGSFRNEEQKAAACVGEPSFDSKDLKAVVANIKPSCMIGAVGRDPGCFNQGVVQAVAKVNARPVIFALSNPKTQAELNASDAYTWSEGKVIYGSGTMMDEVQLGGKVFVPGQVNNVYIFPGVSFGAICCQAQSIPDSFFLAAAEAVAKALDSRDLELSSVLPARERIADVSLEVAVAVVLKAQELGLADRRLGSTEAEVRQAVSTMRWTPPDY